MLRRRSIVPYCRYDSPLLNCRLAGNLIPDIIPWGGYKMWVTIGAAIVTPISFLKRLDSLKYVSFVSLIGFVYLVGISVYYATVWPEGMPDAGTLPFSDLRSY
jgi:amino acid permease